MADLRASTVNIPPSESPGSSESNSPREAFQGKKEKEPVNLREIDPKDLQVAVYNEDKSLAIYGEATRLYVKELKAFPAFFKKWLYKVESPGWTTAIKNQDAVMEWFEKIQSGEIVPDIEDIERYHEEKARAREESKSTLSSVPTISSSVGSKKGGKFSMETVTYKVPRPTPGLKATLKVGSQIQNYIVESVSEYKGSIVEAIIQLTTDKSQRSMIVVHRNSWQVWGFNEKHTIRFN